MNIFSVQEHWTMSTVEAHLGPHADSYDACENIAQQRIFASITVFQGMKRGAHILTVKHPTFSQNMKNAVRTWIDAFTIHI